MQDKESRLFESVRNIADRVEKSVLAFEDACEKVRDGVVINDDFSASQHLISQLNEPKKLEKLSLHQSNLVRILSAIRMGEVLSYEALETKLREWENDILLSTVVQRSTT